MTALIAFFVGLFIGWLVAVIDVVLNIDERNDSHR